VSGWTAIHNQESGTAQITRNTDIFVLITHDGCAIIARQQEQDKHLKLFRNSFFS
jgi:hypothetical protein